MSKAKKIAIWISIAVAVIIVLYILFSSQRHGGNVHLQKITAVFTVVMMEWFAADVIANIDIKGKKKIILWVCAAAGAVLTLCFCYMEYKSGNLLWLAAIFAVTIVYSAATAGIRENKNWLNDLF